MLFMPLIGQKNHRPFISRHCSKICRSGRCRHQISRPHAQRCGRRMGQRTHARLSRHLGHRFKSSGEMGAVSITAQRIESHVCPSAHTPYKNASNHRGVFSYSLFHIAMQISHSTHHHAHTQQRKAHQRKSQTLHPKTRNSPSKQRRTHG